MRRALILIVTLTVLSFGGGLLVDHMQRSTALRYLTLLSGVRASVVENRIEQAKRDEAFLHANWQHDAKWLNALISHHHTRAVNTALLHLSTALDMRWVNESVMAIDEAADALNDIASSDYAFWENIL